MKATISFTDYLIICLISFCIAKVFYDDTNKKINTLETKITACCEAKK